ncbi:MAG: hypothetical protein ACE5FT_00645 [Candidatus Nanoarchaeia archaeon]
MKIEDDGLREFEIASYACMEPGDESCNCDLARFYKDRDHALAVHYELFCNEWRRR